MNNFVSKQEILTRAYTKILKKLGICDDLINPIIDYVRLKDCSTITVQNHLKINPYFLEELIFGKKIYAKTYNILRINCGIGYSLLKCQ